MSEYSENDDEIDLAELFAAMWHNIWVIILSIGVCSCIAAFYVTQIAKPKFQATTRFKLFENSGVPSGLGHAAGLAALAGISLPGPINEADRIKYRILSRPFIDRIYDQSEFHDDPYFNAFLREPGFFSQIITYVVGVEEDPIPTKDDYLVSVMNVLREAMTVSIGDNGIIALSLVHTDAERAASVSNIIVSNVLRDIFEREQTKTRERLGYFEDELLRVQADLDRANAAVRDYAINNNLQSAEVLARTSTQLVQIRQDLDAFEESLNALRALRSDNTDPFEGSRFAQKYPVVNTLSFRRLLNWQSNANFWQRPNLSVIATAENQIIAQMEQLKRNLEFLELQALSSGDAALELAVLEREVQVQKTIYESLITQFEAQSLFFGFEQASGSVIETAIPPEKPISPRKVVTVLIGIVIGTLFGVLITLLISYQKGVLYYEGAFRNNLPKVTMRKLRRSALSKLDGKPLKKSQSIAMVDTLATVQKTGKSVLVISPNSPKLASQLVVGLAKATVQAGDKTTILDLSEDHIGSISSNQVNVADNNLQKTMFADAFDTYTLQKRANAINGTVIADAIKTLSNTYDHVFIKCPAPNQGVALSLFAARAVDHALIAAQTGKTRKSSLADIKTILAKSNITDPLMVIV